MWLSSHEELQLLVPGTAQLVPAIHQASKTGFEQKGSVVTDIPKQITPNQKKIIKWSTVFFLWFVFRHFVHFNSSIGSIPKLANIKGDIKCIKVFVKQYIKTNCSLFFCILPATRQSANRGHFNGQIILNNWVKIGLIANWSLIKGQQGTTKPTGWPKKQKCQKKILYTVNMFNKRVNKILTFYSVG